jgi:uncharacterized protein (UPF0210 family)
MINLETSQFSETNIVENNVNTQLVDKSVMTSIINRLESLEKREPSTSNSTSSASMSFATNTVFTNLEKEVKDLKEILLNHIMKYEKFIINNEKTLVSMEESLQECNQLLAHTTNEETNSGVDLETVNVEDESDNSEDDDEHETEECLTASIDLKQAIQKEFAGSF